MKKQATRTVSLLLATLMLLLAIPVVGTAAASSDVIFSDDFNDGAQNIFTDTASGTAPALPNAVKLENNAMSIYASSATSVMYQFSHVANYPSKGEDHATYTLSFKLTPEVDSFKSLYARFRPGSGNFTWQLFNIKGNKLQFAENADNKYTLQKGTTYEIAILIEQQNVYTAEGKLNGSETTVKGYVNGYLISESTSQNTRSSGKADGAHSYVDPANTIYVGTGTDFDVKLIEWRYNADTTNGSAKVATIDDFCMTRGVNNNVIPTKKSHIAPLAGASIRVGNTVDESGLRFTFGIDRAWFESLSDAEVGAILFPTDYLANGATLDQILEGKYLDIKLANNEFSSESTDDTLCFNASIVKLYAHNYARAFTAVGYVKVGDRYYYSEASDSRSVAEVARNYTASGEVTPAHATRIKEYNDSVIYATVKNGGLYLVESANYTSPYQVSVNADTLTVTLADGAEGDLGAIKAIVIDEVIYTSGWNINNGALTAPYAISAN